MKQKVNQKLSLKKSTIANLRTKEMEAIQGGDDTTLTITLISLDTACMSRCEPKCPRTLDFC